MDHSSNLGFSIPAGGDRLQEQRRVFGSRLVDYKVSTADTNGALFVIEIGDEKHRLGPGDSLLAPRKAPHVWAHVGGGMGKLLIVFQPAGKMEAFFGELAKVEGMPHREELLRLFGSHGMEVTGPPLPVE